MKNSFRVSLLLTLTFFSAALNAQSENEIIDQVEAALKSSSSRELSKYFNDRLEVKLDGEKEEYSANQAEVVLKQFFQKNPSDGTEFIHKGNSRGGIVYAIGNYSSGNRTFRVVVRARKFKDAYRVYRLEFSSDR